MCVQYAEYREVYVHLQVCLICRIDSSASLPLQTLAVISTYLKDFYFVRLVYTCHLHSTGNIFKWMSVELEKVVLKNRKVRSCAAYEDCNLQNEYYFIITKTNYLNSSELKHCSHTESRQYNPKSSLQNQ